MGERSDRAGTAGYACLLALVVAGLAGGAGALLVGVGRIVAGSRQDLADVAQARLLVGDLEGALVWIAAGALGGLIGCVAGVVLLKELADDAARRRRGPVEGER